MKKITLSLIAILAMSVFAVAGGDIAPVEPEITVPEATESIGSLYVGAGYSYMNMDSSTDHDGDAILLIAGYNFNQYFGIEARIQ